MALLFMDGFDHYGNSTVIVGLGKWITGGTILANTPARTGSNSVRGTGGAVCGSKILPASGGAVIGFAYQLIGVFGAGDLFQIIEGAIVHMAIGVTAGGLLTVKRGATVLATGTTVLSTSSWYYIEFKVVIDDINGSYEVRIDGVTEAALTNTGPVDTRNVGTTGQWDRVQMVFSLASGFAYFDDVYICDLSGAAPRNNFLGTIKIESLLPQTDAVAVGSNTGLTPSTGTDHGALVDETTPNTTDYNGSATVGVKDTYQYPNMILSGTIYGIQTNLYIAKSDAAARQVCAVVRHNSVDTDGANVSPLTTYSYFSEVRALKPDASAWTVADINAIQAGMKVTV